MSALSALHLPTEPLQHAAERAAERLSLDAVVPDRQSAAGTPRHRVRTGLLLGVPVLGALLVLLVRRRRATALAEQHAYLAAT